MLSSLKKIAVLVAVVFALKLLSLLPNELVRMLAIILILGILGILGHMRFRNNGNFKF